MRMYHIRHAPSQPRGRGHYRYLPCSYIGKNVLLVSRLISLEVFNRIASSPFFACFSRTLVVSMKQYFKHNQYKYILWCGLSCCPQKFWPQSPIVYPAAPEKAFKIMNSALLFRQKGPQNRTENTTCQHFPYQMISPPCIHDLPSILCIIVSSTTVVVVVGNA